jgi:hypothetical protein
MLTHSISLLLAAILIMSMAAFAATASAQQQQVGSDGGLTATLNGENFRREDKITVNGTVEERDIDSYVAIEIMDPRGEEVENGYPNVTEDNTFAYSFTAGENEGALDQPMVVSGSYTVIVRYFPPGEDLDAEEVEFVFAYDANGVVVPPGINATAPPTTTAVIGNTTTAAGGAIDVALLNNTAIQAIEDMGELIAVLQPYIRQPDGSIHPDIVTYFNLVLDGLYNIQGNLTGVTPLPRE